MDLEACEITYFSTQFWKSKTNTKWLSSFSHVCFVWSLYFKTHIFYGYNLCGWTGMEILIIIFTILIDIIGVCRAPMWSKRPAFRNRQFAQSESHWIAIMFIMSRWCHNIVTSHGDGCLQTWKKMSHRNSVFADTSNLWLTVYLILWSLNFISERNVKGRWSNFILKNFLWIFFHVNQFYLFVQFLCATRR